MLNSAERVVPVKGKEKKPISEMSLLLYVRDLIWNTFNALM